MHNRRALLLLVVLINVLLLALWRTSGAAPKSAAAPEREFSAHRAHAVLRGLLPDGGPHPASSAANARVRDRVIARFRELGYDARVQRCFVCSPAATCATVENVIAERQGTRSGDALLLAVHYDSVPAGPGASDDGTGVASCSRSPARSEESVFAIAWCSSSTTRRKWHSSARRRSSPNRRSPVPSAR
jgi:hypothetical protein